MVRGWWIFKGTSNFCSELIYDVDQDKDVKAKPEGFYDIVSDKDTIEGGIHVIDATGMPSKEEIKRALKVINAVAQISALHGMWTEPVPEVMKTLNWLEELSK